MKALLVDGLNLVRRIYAAIPTSTGVDSNDSHINGVIDSASASLNRALTKHDPSHGLVIFEFGGKNWRHQLFPDYKKDRLPMPKPLKNALEDFELAFSKLGIKSFSLPGYEADDIIATIANKVALRKGHVVILSTDRNLCQLLGKNIEVFDHFSDKSLDTGMIMEKFHVNPDQIPDLMALAGDNSLSIPGIKSIGIRTAAKLINQYGSLERVLSAADNMPGKLGSKLYHGKEDARLAQQLFTLKTDIELGINLSQYRYFPFSQQS